MTREQATEVANSWHDVAERVGLPTVEYRDVAALLRRTLPDDTDAAAGASVSGDAGVLALAGEGLFVMTVQRLQGDRPPQLEIERIPFTPTQVALRISDHWGEDTVRRGTQFRTWTLTWPDQRIVSFESIVRTRGFDTGPDDAERFGRVVAGRLEWDLPLA